MCHGKKNLHQSPADTEIMSLMFFRGSFEDIGYGVEKYTLYFISKGGSSFKQIFFVFS